MIHIYVYVGNIIFNKIGFMKIKIKVILQKLKEIINNLIFAIVKNK